ncbi:chloride channel protein 2-like isoform X1 [Acanthaster planci]|uniref:Chloride channel protein 2-like isoform X1 n=1 Tax=Acanthaster planci TaxID=133434 RepID=A0A8B7ZX78_ACAPL|nr:chloride channel protein 2-like isoform X1 [Acanthaster planci]
MALQPDRRELGYEQTLMYGRYRQELSQFAKNEAARQREEKKRQKQLDDEFRQYRGTCCYTVKSNLIWFRDFVFSKIGEDWIFLALLGIIMALLSFAMDYAIAKCQTAQVQLFMLLKGLPVLQYFGWVGFSIILIIFSSVFVHLVSPNAIGSGIPEMKTILRGVVLKEYLSFRTLISKVIGVAASLGSGLPIGKEGPFVHIASIVSTMLSKLIVTFKGIFENESRNSEMLAAACAVGVSCNFAAPIGGVLFSIEVTSTYFAVRNYWRGFFGAVCGAFVFRLLAVWNKDEETITALFKTTFRVDFPFDPQELIAFAFIGIVCGFGGALFVFVHRRIVDFNRTHKKVSAFLMKNRFLYPLVVSLVISSITFPLGLGQFMAGELTQKQQIDELFSNTTLGNDPTATIDEENKFKPWHRPNVFVTLGVFIVMQFWMTALAVTLPVPAGVFIPVFTLGAAFGRLVGECMAAWFPQGIHTSDAVVNKVIPGGYAVVGAAALSGSVTHTISTSVIVFELTGQITHILPVMMAVLIANAIAQLLQPSFYDSIIQIKKLPYLPDISHAGSKTYEIFVEDIMVRYVKFISWLSTYADLKELLDTSPKLQSFPLVDAPESMILLGSVQRSELEYMIEKKIGLARRLAVVADRKRAQGQSQPSPSDRFSVVSFNAKPDENNSQQISIRDAGNKDASAISLSNLELSLTVLLRTSPRASPRSSFSSQGMFRRYGSRDSIQSSSTDSLEGTKKKVRVYKLPIGEFEDMSVEEQEEWEADELKVQLDFSEVHIDPAPFQLVERTSLHKCHSMFSLLGLNHTYVTTLGRLVGVVSLKEIRRAIERSAESNNRGSFRRSQTEEPQNIIQAERSSS